MNNDFKIRKKTIKDFNNQWKLQGELNDDYWASDDVIFDQLNPQYAKYYKKQEILKELTKAGFKNLKISHRHKYSWTVVGKKL